MRLTSKKLLVAAISVGTLAASTTGAFAYGSYDGGSSYSDGRDGLRTVSYINRDTGAATENPDVNKDSSCFNPDQYDMQMFSDAGTANRNVHNDACFLDDRGNKAGKGIGATFRSSGTGFISACPDPDGAGPERAVLADKNGDGRADSCFQSSYQDRGVLGTADVAGDFEYHARLNNNNAQTPGEQQVKWGLDRDGDGFIDDRNDDDIKVDWSATGMTGSSYRW